MITKDTPINELMHHDDVLCHYGKRGMKWGVRNDDKRTSGSNGRKNMGVGSNTVSRNKNSKKGSSSTTKPNVKVTIKQRRKKTGMKIVSKHENTKVKLIVSNVANVSAGALRVAACFVPGLSGLSAAANIAALTGTVANLKK